MSYKFFTNFSCEYYPCHDFAEINCLFCFCPLYHMEKCPGTPQDFNGIKDCSACAFPHNPDNYEKICKLLIPQRK